VPALPGARQAWLDGIRTGGADRNEQYLRDRVRWGTASDVDRALLIDPQTSGGLLVAVSSARAAEYLSLVSGAIDIGEVVAVRDVGLVLA
jgi:selenide,water dikinase